MPSALDEVLPAWDVNEVHETFVAAAPERVWEALRDVTPLDVRALVPLMLVRALPGLVLRHRRLDVDLRRPLLQAFLSNGFLVLRERASEELVVGAVGHFWRVGGEEGVRRVASPEAWRSFDAPGWAKAAMSFVVRPHAAGSRVITETRVAGTDAEGTRLFRRYWRVIMPGSAAIRRSWLAAIRRRATS